MTTRHDQDAEQMRPQLEIRLLGPVELCYHPHQTQQFPTHSARLIFSFLVLNRTRRIMRQVVANTIWSDGSDSDARRKLRSELHRVRKTLRAVAPNAANLLHADHKCVGFAVAGPYWLDVDVFEKCVRGAESGRVKPSDPKLGRQLRKALSLYRGDLLEGEYDKWCLAEQDRLKAMKRRAIELLFSHYLHCSDWQRACDCGIELLTLNPLREHIHRELMILYYLIGDRPLALKQYDVCHTVLERELSVRPMRLTTDLYEALKVEDTTSLKRLISRNSTPGFGDRALARTCQDRGGVAR